MDRAADALGGVEFRVLGAIEIRVDGELVGIGGARQRRLLAALIARAGTVLSADALAEMVWEDHEQPNHAVDAVRTYVSRLRRGMADSGVEARRVVVTEPPGYRLALVGARLDSDLFTALIQNACSSIDGSDARAVVDSLDSALALWRGEPYAEFPDRWWSEPEVARLQELRAVAFEERAVAQLALGFHAEAVADLEQQVAENRLRSRPVELLLVALFRAGRQAEALRVADRHRRDLAEVGLEPSAELTELERRIAVSDVTLLLAPEESAPVGGGTPSAPVGGAPRLTGLPVPTGRLFGRNHEMASITQQFSEGARLVTLTGPGGVGKTRLAIAIARELSDRIPVTFVDLTPLRRWDELVSTLRDAVEGPNTDGAPSASAAEVPSPLIESLLGQPQLVVLDNCEHLLDEVATLVEQLCGATSECLFLATSQEPLDLPGERLSQVQPLDTAVDGPAVELFIDLLQQAGPTNMPVDRADLATLCADLDGLPLALELAAARCATLTLDEVHAGLSDRFSLLTRRRRTGDRHRSLQQTLDWSWDLLGADEQSALMQLAAFGSSWTLAAMAEVLELTPAAATELLDRLAAKSLVARAPNRGGRYSMLESIRAYARDRARQQDKWTIAADRHLRWLDDLTTDLVERINTVGETEEAMARLDAEIDEIRTALNDAAAGADAATGLKVATRLWEWWRARVLLTEEGVDRITGLLEAADVEPADRVAALVACADLLRLLPRRGADADGALEQARRQLDAIAEPALANRLLLRLLVADFDSDDDSVPQQLEALVTSARRDGSSEDAMALHLLTLWDLRQGSRDKLDGRARETMAAAARTGNPASIAHAEEIAGLVAIVGGRFDIARAHLGNALDGFEASAQVGCLLHACESIAWLAIRTGRRAPALELLANCRGLRVSLARLPTLSQVTVDQIIEDLGELPPPNATAEIDRTLEMSRELLFEAQADGLDR